MKTNIFEGRKIKPRPRPYRKFSRAAMNDKKMPTMVQEFTVIYAQKQTLETRVLI